MLRRSHDRPLPEERRTRLVKVGQPLKIILTYNSKQGCFYIGVCKNGKWPKLKRNEGFICIEEGKVVEIPQLKYM